MFFFLSILSQLISEDTAIRFKASNNPLQIFRVYLQYDMIADSDKNKQECRYITKNEYIKDVESENTIYTIPIKQFCRTHNTLIFIISYGERRVITDKYIINIPLTLDMNSNIMEMEPKVISIEKEFKSEMELYELNQQKSSSKWNKILLLVFLVAFSGILGGLLFYMIRSK